MANNIFFNAHHSPVGAFASFTLGYKGKSGGLGLELAGPAQENVYVGLEEPGSNGRYRSLPFYEIAESAAQDYDVEGLSEFAIASALEPFKDSEITRNFGAGIDEWVAGDLSFKVISPIHAIPDPQVTDAKDATVPAVLVELTIDNTQGTESRRAFFGYAGSDRGVGMRILDEPGLTGVGQGTTTAIATQEEGVYAGLAWQPEVILSANHPENLTFMLGSIGLLVGTVEPGEKRTFRFSVAFFREATATTGIRTKYLYRRWFDRIEQVLSYSLSKAADWTEQADGFDRQLVAKLSPDRAFMAAHAIRSYFGSTQLLEREDGRPLWVIHEGEYRMMNTFDLTVDQTFFELGLNPWTVKNVLDLFVEKYSYIDEARLPGSDQTYPAGITFTHDMGVSNAFSRPGYSGYEQAGLTGCFSYMSAEELMNWVLTAGMYVFHTNDQTWAKANIDTIKACLHSLVNRDHPEESKRNGVVGLDGNRCLGGAEITTYDSLDASLGQARNSLYLAVKGWSCFIYLEALLIQLGETGAAELAASQAALASATILGSTDNEGLFPAIIGEGVDARTIPAIEALVYPCVAGLVDDRFAVLREALRVHFDRVLTPGVCKFEDGGWKLSSTSNNSWLSKIYLCQFVAESVLGHAPDQKADAAHVQWLLDTENSFFAWSDQMLSGKAVGSRYYPRGVTSILWLAGGDKPLEGVEHFLRKTAVRVPITS